MGIVGSGFTSSLSNTTYVEYEEQVNDTFGFISWSGQITSVTCAEYLNGNYYTSYTLISNKQCVDYRAVWGITYSTFSFNYGYVTCDTKLVMTVKTTLGTATITQEYLLKPQASLEPPGNPSITQNPDGTYTAEWTQATGSNGSGNVTYRLFDVKNGGFWTNESTSLRATLTIPSYNHEYTFQVIAYYSGLTVGSGSVKKTFYPPDLSTPTLTKSADNNQNLTLSWTPATLSYTEGTITYYLYAGSNLYSETRETSVTIPASSFESWGGTKSHTFYVTAIASGLKNTSQGASLSKTSNSVTFSYVTPHKTVKYYDGSSWVECIVYYCTGTEWVECIPYYCDGTSWIECSST